MQRGSTLYHVEVNLSDVDAGVYETFSVRVALHPSEDKPRLAARMLAYCLAYQEGISFGRGLQEPDDPALSVKDAAGNLQHWIDVGHPGAERLHRASKAAPRVTVVCHKNPDGLIREREKRPIHAADQIAIWLLSPELVQAVAEQFDRKNAWTVVRTGEDLLVHVNEHPFAGSLMQTTLSRL